ncbi:hypothetical protein BCU89_19380 [Vibrio splendidus]|nr:hypothetical protein BCU89_19380 [Vibrio splendidus]
MLPSPLMTFHNGIYEGVTASEVRTAAVSNGSSGARTIADLVINQGVALSRYLATKLMKTLGSISCQLPRHQ